MAWVEIVALLALLQYLVFGFKVGQARGRYQVQAPAVTGHEVFERHHRVQMNTLEQLIVFLPALGLAALHWPGGWVAAVGLVFLIGRALYAAAYVKDPARRGLGFMLSVTSSSTLLVLAALGVLRSLL